MVTMVIRKKGEEGLNVIRKEECEMFTVMKRKVKCLPAEDLNCRHEKWQGVDQVSSQFLFPLLIQNPEENRFYSKSHPE